MVDKNPDNNGVEVLKFNGKDFFQPISNKTAVKKFAKGHGNTFIVTDTSFNLAVRHTISSDKNIIFPKMLSSFYPQSISLKYKEINENTTEIKPMIMNSCFVLDQICDTRLNSKTVTYKGTLFDGYNFENWATSDIDDFGGLLDLAVKKTIDVTSATNAYNIIECKYDQAKDKDKNLLVDKNGLPIPDKSSCDYRFTLQITKDKWNNPLYNYIFMTLIQLSFADNNKYEGVESINLHALSFKQKLEYYDKTKKTFEDLYGNDVNDSGNDNTNNTVEQTEPYDSRTCFITISEDVFWDLWNGKVLDDWEVVEKDVDKLSMVIRNKQHHELIFTVYMKRSEVNMVLQTL